MLHEGISVKIKSGMALDVELVRSTSNSMTDLLFGDGVQDARDGATEIRFAPSLQIDLLATLLTHFLRVSSTVTKQMN